MSMVGQQALWLGAAGAWIFVLVALVEGARRPAYDPVRQPVSALALGPRGWIQTANFVACGVAITLGALALPGALGSLFLGVVVGVFGIALVASGGFPMDPMRGYPPGTPDTTPAELSLHHRIHDAVGVIVFGALPGAALIAAAHLSGWWVAYSVGTAALTLIGFVTFGTAWERDSPRAGLIQRLTIVGGWVWLGLLFASATG